MAMTGKAKRTVYYRYPIELVWKAIGTGDNREVDPLTLEEFESQEPAPNMIFTKVLEKEENKVFAFRMKARGFIGDVRMELTPVGPCETKVVFSEVLTFRLVSSYIFGKFGLCVRDEMRSLAQEIHRRLEEQNKKANG